MTNLHYIKSVCLENRLEDTIAHFLTSSDEQYHADRHVSPPPLELSAFSACEAGLALLQQWTADAANVHKSGLSPSTPILMIDDEWLSGADNAPPPHVLLSLFKSRSDSEDQPIAGVRVAHDSSPFKEILCGPFAHTVVYRLEPNEDFPESGAWVIQFDKSAPMPDSPPSTPRG